MRLILFFRDSASIRVSYANTVFLETLLEFIKIASRNPSSRSQFTRTRANDDKRSWKSLLYTRLKQLLSYNVVTSCAMSMCFVSRGYRANSPQRRKGNRFRSLAIIPPSRVADLHYTIYRVYIFPFDGWVFSCLIRTTQRRGDERHNFPFPVEDPCGKARPTMDLLRGSI